MKVRNAIVAMSLSAVVLGAGLGCDSVKHAADKTVEVTTGDLSKDYTKTFDQCKKAIDATGADLKLVVVSALETKDKDARPIYTLITRTTDDKKLRLIATFVSPEKTNVTIDTSAFTGGSDFRKEVEAKLEANLAK